MDWYSPCTATVTSVDWCTSAFINFTNTASAKCERINFFWGHPANNLTMILETPFTQARQAYNISLNIRTLMTTVLHVYQIIDNKEIDVTTSASTIILKSDSNYQVVIKFQCPSQARITGVGIRYVVVKPSKKNIFKEK